MHVTKLPFPVPSKRGVLIAAGVVSFLGILASAEAATSREVDRGPSTPEVFMPQDPYLAYLDELAGHSPSCKSQTDAVRKMLSALDEHIANYAAAAGDKREDVVAAIAKLTPDLRKAERNLAECFELIALGGEDSKLWTDVKAPPVPEPPEVVVAEETPEGEEEPRRRRDRSRRDEEMAVPPPVPAFPAIPPAPPRELAFLELLQQEAGDGTFSAAFVADVESLLGERRQLALRFLQAREEERPTINFVISVVSRRMHQAADAILDPTTLAAN
jgi:hypothetical protein